MLFPNDIKRIREKHDGWRVVEFELKNSADKPYAFLYENGTLGTQRYDRVESYSEGMAVVQNKNSCYFIDTQGKVALGPFLEAESFSDGWASVKLNDGYRYTNKKGEFQEGVYYLNSRYSEGRGTVVLPNKLYAFVDENGKLLEGRYKNAYSYKEGFAAVETEAGWNFIDKNGNFLSDEFFDEVESFSNGFAVVKRKNGNYSYLDKLGHIRDAEGYDYAGSYSDGIAPVSKNGKQFFIDISGAKIGPEYEKIETIQVNSEKYIFCAKRKGENWRFVNKNGEQEGCEFLGINDGFVISKGIRLKNDVYASVDENGFYILPVSEWKRVLKANPEYFSRISNHLFSYSDKIEELNDSVKAGYLERLKAIKFDGGAGEKDLIMIGKEFDEFCKIAEAKKVEAENYLDSVIKERAVVEKKEREFNKKKSELESFIATK